MTTTAGGRPPAYNEVPPAYPNISQPQPQVQIQQPVAPVVQPTGQGQPQVVQVAQGQIIYVGGQPMMVTAAMPQAQGVGQVQVAPVATNAYAQAAQVVQQQQQAAAPQIIYNNNGQVGTAQPGEQQPPNNTTNGTMVQGQGQGQGTRGSQSCSGPSGLINDNRSMSYYLIALCIIILFEIIGYSLEIVDEMATVEYDYDYTFGVSEVDVSVEYYGVTYRDVETYEDLCNEDDYVYYTILDDSDFDWCTVDDKGNTFITFIVFSFIASTMSIILLSIIICCGPRGCCNCDTCCECCTRQTCCNGMCLKNSAIWSMISVFIVNFIGCLVWSSNNPIEDICDDYDVSGSSCTVNWGSTWWITLVIGFVHIGIACMLASKNTLKCM